MQFHDVSWHGELDLKERPLVIRYGVTLVSVALALALTVNLPAIRFGTPYLFFFLAVIICSLFGGLGAGVASVVLSTLAVAFWVLADSAYLQLTSWRLVQIPAFVMVASTMTLLINALRRAKAYIYAKHDSLLVTLESIGDAVIATDTAGKVIWLNAAAAELTGSQSNQAADVPVETLFPTTTRDTHLPTESPLRKALAEKASCSWRSCVATRPVMSCLIAM